MKGKIACSWSGGKDSCFALMKAMEAGYEPVVLVNMMNETGQRSRSHGLPQTILSRQAAALGIPLITRNASWADYQALFVDALKEAKESFGAEKVVFGDIDLQEHRDWEEMVCAAAGLNAMLPLWQKDRLLLVRQMLAGGIQTIIVSCNEQMGSPYLGKVLDLALVEELAAQGVDPCGENGEFHTMVIDTPIFKNRIGFSAGAPVAHGNYWFLDGLG
ncbi:diphthine--ammonia ligase [Flavihumibacter rivuli]|uniref:Dph6-related ATP pyrophosphatase n=1 Tax=Flavihumibacter rivuli TaxID=2838156 RepID=UPI001BDF54D4|nr:diphthine--ammonia ligase [Flavihumibacter rivuli]ULQ56734.1 diphthine--ammonia ligase [Flavihumibacter rivuli]